MPPARFRPRAFDTPPGLYGSDEGFTALNFFAPATRSPRSILPTGVAVTAAGLAGSGTTELRPALLLTAFLLLVADSIAVFVMGGALSGLFSRRRAGSAAAIVLALAATLTLMPQDSRAADDSRPGDDKIVSALDTTHLAYVRTGEADVDRIFEAGLMGLSDFIRYRTSLEPGDPVGPRYREGRAGLFPDHLLAVTATAPMPSQEAINRIDAYMRAGGTLLFDTRDQDTSLEGAAAGPNTERLQAILASLDIPPLEPVPNSHVLNDEILLSPAELPRPLRRKPALDRSDRRCETRCGAPRAARRRRLADPDHRQRLCRRWATDRSGNPLLPTVPPDDASVTLPSAPASTSSCTC